MVYSTKYYFVKPIIPTIKYGLTICGIKLIKFDARTALLISDDFKQSSQYYYQYDKTFAQQLRKYKRKIQELHKQNILHWRGNPESFEQELRKLEIILEKLEYICFDYSFDRCPYLFEVASAVELNFWLRTIFKQRKRIIKKYYPKKAFPETFFLLNACNDFLKSLGKHSIELTNSLDLFFSVGSNLDWFLLSITECSYHQSIEFKELFSSNIRLKNDLIEIAGVFTIMQSSSFFKLYLDKDKTILQKVQLYKKLLRGLLLSGNEIIDLEILKERVKRNEEKQILDHSEKVRKEEMLLEIESMHDLAIDRRIYDFDNSKQAADCRSEEKTKG
ncbi:hypothetical protein [Enterococcus avium]|uniref:hypothetical protein n=1 Tax=Enterococcus avium TaxID=33945 RepID=UPI001F57AA1D|nr:hypothetical protein [Enterococcus avium]